MSKKHNIRWTEDDREALRKAVKNFNARRARLIKKFPEKERAFPEKVTVKAIKELIQTRNDLNRELNALQRFNHKTAKLVVIPNNDYNLETTKWQRNEMSRRAGIINRKRKKRLKDVMETELTYQGEKLGYTIGQFGMGKADEVALLPVRPFTKSMTRTSFNKKYDALLNESRDRYWSEREQIMQVNFIESILHNYNPEDVKDIVKRISEMSFKEFYKIFKSDTHGFEIASFEASKVDYENYLSALRATWLPNYKEGE